MTAREVLVKACSKNETAPYTPLALITTGVTVKMMERAKVYWPEAHSDPEMMAVLGAMGYEQYGIPCLKVPFDAAVEAGVLGARVELGSLDTFPQIGHSHTVTCAKQLRIPDDLAGAGRIPVVLEAVRIQRKRYPEMPIVCHTMGPFAMLSLVFGFGKLLEWMVLEDTNFEAAMEISTELSIRYSKLIEEAGADIIQFGEAASSSEVIGVNTYAERVAPYHKQLSGHLTVPTVLHICGDITPCLHVFHDVGVDAVSYDFKVSNIQAKKIFDGKIKTIGNIDPLGVLLNGDPEMVRSAVMSAMDDGVDVLAPGCCLPPRMPEDNLVAMVQAYKEYLSSKGIKMA